MERRTIDLDGPVHYVDFGGEGPALVLVHGLGGSHANWLAVAPRLTAHGRVLAIDLAGHGHTPSLGRTAKVGANRRLLGRFLAEVAGGPATVVGNSMGGFISLGLAATEPEKVGRLILVDPAIPMAPGAAFDPRVIAFFAGVLLPGVGGFLMRRRSHRTAEQHVREILALCCVDSSRIPADVMAAHIALARERLVYGRAVGRDFLEAVRSLTASLLRWQRFYKMVESVRAPTLIIQGERDRLVHIASVRALAAARRDWRLEVLDDVGHVPQLETPERFLGVVEPWLRDSSPR